MDDKQPLLPANRTATENLLSETLIGTTDLESDGLIRSLYSADACPADLLSYLAQAVAVDQWDHRWPEQQKREVIEGALEIHRTKGTPMALLKAISNHGINATLREWWLQQDPQWYLPPSDAVPGTVVVQTLLNDNYDLDKPKLDKMNEAIKHAKRHSIHIAHEMGLKWDETLAFSSVAANPMSTSDLDAEISPLHPESGLVTLQTSAGGHRMTASDIDAQVSPLHPESGQVTLRTAAGGHRMVVADFEFGGTQ